MEIKFMTRKQYALLNKLSINIPASSNHRSFILFLLAAILGFFPLLSAPAPASEKGTDRKNTITEENGVPVMQNQSGLVMTYATSLYDENGEKRLDFALGNLARIKYHNPDYQMSEKMSKSVKFGSGYDIYLKTRTKQEVIKSPIADGLIPTHLYETVDVLPGGTIAADIVTGSDNEVIVPGLIVSRYGKGKVAYISAATGAMFLQTGIMEYAVIEMK